jgi:hypothetical protein
MAAAVVADDPGGAILAGDKKQKDKTFSTQHAE